MPRARTAQLRAAGRQIPSPRATRDALRRRGEATWVGPSTTGGAPTTQPEPHATDVPELLIELLLAAGRDDE